MSYLIFGLRGTLFAVFVASLVSKLLSRTAFVAFARGACQVVGVDQRFAGGIAAIVVVSEATVLAGLAMVGDGGIGFAIAVAGLVMFTAALTAAVVQDRRISCRCFGPDDAVVGGRHLVRNGVLIAVGCVGLVAGTGEPRQGGAAAVALAAGLIAGFVLTRWDDLVYLVVPESVAGRMG